MSEILPVGSNKLNNPSHSHLHRVVAVDDQAYEQTLIIGKNSVNSSQPIVAPNLTSRRTYLNISGPIVNGSSLSVVANGTNYTKSGDDGNLNSSADNFNGNEAIQLFLNGVKQQKGISVIWLSSATFQLLIALDNGDTIQVLS